MINLLSKISHLVGDLMDFDEYVKSHVDSILISKMYQSREIFDKAKAILNKTINHPKVILEIWQLIFLSS